jgi:aerobic C4-dicarboxylate transport protein
MELVNEQGEPIKERKSFYKVLYFQVIAAIILGVAVGFFFPDLGEKLKPPAMLLSN